LAGSCEEVVEGSVGVISWLKTVSIGWVCNHEGRDLKRTEVFNQRMLEMERKLCMRLNGATEFNCFEVTVASKNGIGFESGDSAIEFIFHGAPLFFTIKGMVEESKVLTEIASGCMRG
jgi:hypothetical protein